MKRVLVINLNDLGDIVFSIPLMKNLKEMGYIIDFLVDENYKWAITPFSNINKLIILRRSDIKDKFLNEFKISDEVENFIHNLKSEKYDISINLHSSFLSAYIHSYVNSKLKIGLVFQNNKYVYLNTDSYYLDTLSDIINKKSNFFHAVTLFNTFLLPLNKPIVDYDVLYDYGYGDFEKNTVVVHIGAGNNVKKWIPENWIKLIKLLLNDNYKVYLVGIAEDLKESQYISEKFKGNKNFYNFTGQMPMEKYINFLKKIEYLITADTGILHIAAALGKKVIGIYGSTSIYETGAFSFNSVNISLNLPCSPCFNNICGNKKCMKKLDGNIIYLLVKHFKDKEIYSTIEKKYNVKIFIPDNFINKKNIFFIRKQEIDNYLKKYKNKIARGDFSGPLCENKNDITKIIFIANYIWKTAVLSTELNKEKRSL